MDSFNKFFQNHPNLKLSSRDLELFKSSAVVKPVTTGDLLLYQGATCEYLPVLISGDIRVHKTAENGREIVLYHLSDEESCILSALSILNDSDFPATASVNADGKILLIPARLLKMFVENYSGWRMYVFSLYNKRLNVVLDLIDTVLFQKLDIRLARFLINRMNKNNSVLQHTHQSLADELGSSREVISRLLRSLSDRNIIQYRRNEIIVLEKEKLTKIAEL